MRLRIGSGMAKLRKRGTMKHTKGTKTRKTGAGVAAAAARDAAVRQGLPGPPGFLAVEEDLALALEFAALGVGVVLLLCRRRRLAAPRPGHAAGVQAGHQIAQ